MEGVEPLEGRDSPSSLSERDSERISQSPVRIQSDMLQSINAKLARHRRSGSFQRWRHQMQRAWKWGPNHEENGLKSSLNVEAMANQKRQWYQIHSQSRDHKQHKEPTSLFEHFVIVGLHSYANVEAIEDDFVKRKRWESEMAKNDALDLGKYQYHAPPLPTLEPQVLFKYPPGEKLAMRTKDLPAFCFPGGVKANLLQRTPSMSDLNEIVCGQEHLACDDFSFIFRLKVADNATLYGVCLHVQELVQRPPGILGYMSPMSQPPSRCSRYLVAAPRCYCILTKVPFFELHYEMLNSIIAQERLNRITQFVSEVTLTADISQEPRFRDDDENFESPEGGRSPNWMASAIPVNSVIGLVTIPASPLSDYETPSIRASEPQSPESISTSDASDFSHVRELEKFPRKNLQYFDDHVSETSESLSDSSERMNGSVENGQASPESSSLPFLYGHISEQFKSLESVSVRSMGLDDEEIDEATFKHEKYVGDEKVMEWAKVHKNELLQIICGYHNLPLPQRESETVFQPLEHLQPIKYSRPSIPALCSVGGFTDAEICESSLEVNEVNGRLAAAEEALALSIWTTATICRALSLESVLTLIAGALLEKQLVVICPNLGVLSAIVLSIIPMIRPFEWQSLLLPVLPRKMLDFLDAPVPFIVGLQHKPADMKIKSSNLVRINVDEDQVKTCSLPSLPHHRELISQLGPIHARLSCENLIAKRHPVYKCSEVQAEAASQFLNVMRCYLESLCSELRFYTITSVQSNNDKVSMLLKESFIDSFPSRDRPFIKLFVDTQMFSVLSDSRLKRYENE
ncbi:hypothetical protein QJS04_geneDACA002241 [Acorus gramineus]|uniref:UDENN domain-containing protein n=1 Tax=Acorus gramineus TaxID=55184 RepID=A0AAV9A9F7_ACOGR|nr:hypothetical protein QJS04_geneDACA002241 [Acorus gramineus]